MNKQPKIDHFRGMIQVISSQHFTRYLHVQGIYPKGNDTLLDNPYIVKSCALGRVFIDKATNSTFCTGYKVEVSKA